MIEHVVGRRCVRSRVTRGVSRAVALPTLTVFPARGPLAQLIPLIDLACVPIPRSRAVRRSKVRGGHWVGEQIVPKDALPSDGAVLYMHGGAFLFCGLNSHRPVATGLALNTGLPVLSVDYRMTPRGTVAEAVDDCLDAFHWLVSQGADPAKIVLAGDSAGGHLAFAVTLALRERGYDPAGIVAFSPWVDFDHTTKTCHANRSTDVLIPATRLRKIALRVLGVDSVDPSHSPVNADLTGLPPVLMMCADDEVLRIDAELMHDRLVAHGVPAELQIWSGVLHAFPVVPVPWPDILDARVVAADFILDCVAVASSDRADVVA